MATAIPVRELSDMEQALFQTLQTLVSKEESLPFREPVDIPHYKKVIRNPMDLSTINQKLISGDYGDPWMYIEDIWLMFENAWAYNHKQSQVHQCATVVRFFFLYFLYLN